MISTTINKPEPHVAGSSDAVAVGYERVYAASRSVADEKLRMSRERLCRNYGVFDAPVNETSERLPIALRLLDAKGLEGKTILDVGCGSGKAAVVFAQAGARVVALDISLSSLAIARRRAEVNGVDKQISVSVGSADNLCYQSDAFDFVFGYEVLYYVTNRQACAREILRVLKPGGTAVLCEALSGNPLLRSVRGLLRYSTGTVNRSGGVAIEIGEIERAFKGNCRTVVHPVNLFGMAKRLFRTPSRASNGISAFFKKCDALLFDWFPGSRTWCGEGVIVVEKDTR